MPGCEFGGRPHIEHDQLTSPRTLDQMIELDDLELGGVGLEPLEHLLHFSEVAVRDGLQPGDQVRDIRIAQPVVDEVPFLATADQSGLAQHLKVAGHVLKGLAQHLAQRLDAVFFLRKKIKNLQPNATGQRFCYAGELLEQFRLGFPD